MGDSLLVYCTFPNVESAESMARALVDQRLAACVNVLDSVRSVYRWEGEVCAETECMTIAKTTVSCFELLKAHILKLHPYDCPEVVAVKIEHGHDDYLRWIAAETRTDDPG